MDFENNIDIPKRSIALEKLIASNPFKFFTLEGTINELVDFIKESQTKMVFQKAKEYLEISF